MKIGVISDIHGNFKALNSVVDDMKKQDISEYIVLGDIIFFGDEPQKCYELIAELNPIAWVRGNTDDWLNEIDDNFVPSSPNEEETYIEYMRVMDLINSDAIEHIKHLPLTSVIKVEGLSILTAHGSDRRYNEGVGIMTTHSDIEDLFNRLPTNIMLCGHTHRQYFASDTGKTIINVGSVGSSINKPFAEYAILSLKKNSLSYEFKSINVK